MTAKRFTHNSQFTSDAVTFAGASASGDAVASETKSIDIALAADSLLTGAVVIVNGAKIDDKVSLQIIHPQAGVLDEFVTDWFMCESQDNQFLLELSFPANLPTGLLIRAIYKASAATGTRKIRLNYMLYRVLEQA